MRLFIINLDRCVERMRRIGAAFDDMGVAFERFSAVDGNLLPRTDNRSVIVHANRRITNSELGCLLSHKSIWDMAADGPDDFVAVFEDDIHISGRLGAFLQEANRFKGLDEFADLIKIETTGDLVTLSSGPKIVLGEFPLHALRSTHYGTAGYLISPRGARILSAAAESRVMLADHIFIKEEFDALGVRVLQAVPGLVMQDQYGFRAGLEPLGFERTVEQDHSSRLRSRDMPMMALLAREARRLALKAVSRIPLWLKGRDTTLRVAFDKAETTALKAEPAAPGAPGCSAGADREAPALMNKG